MEASVNQHPSLQTSGSAEKKVKNQYFHISSSVLSSQYIYLALVCSFRVPIQNSLSSPLHESALLRPSIPPAVFSLRLFQLFFSLFRRKSRSGRPMKWWIISPIIAIYLSICRILVSATTTNIQHIRQRRATISRHSSSKHLYTQSLTAGSRTLRRPKSPRRRSTAVKLINVPSASTASIGGIIWRVTRWWVLTVLFWVRKFCSKLLCLL